MDFIDRLIGGKKKTQVIWKKASDGSELRFSDLLDQVNQISQLCMDIPKQHVVAVNTAGPAWETLCGVLAVISSGRVALPTQRTNIDSLNAIGVAGLLSNGTEQKPSLKRLSKNPKTAPQAQLLLKTSGTGGAQRHVMLGAEGILTNIRGILSYLPLSKSTRVGLLTPLHYSYGLIGQCMTALHAGSTIVSLTRGPWIRRQVEEMAGHGVEVFSAVPSILKSLMRVADQQRLPDLKLLASAGAPLSTQLVDEIFSKFPDISLWNQYGMTEASPRIAAGRIFKDAFVPGYVGRPLPGVSLQTKGPTSRNNPGPILVKTPAVMLGYWQETQSIVHDGVLHSGDMGWMDKDGNLHICAREDDLVKIGGERLSLSKTETTISGIASVEECVVLPVADGNFGLGLVAFVISTNVEKTILMNKIRSLLPPISRPKEVHLLKEFPHGSNGKTDKEELLRIHQGQSR